MLIKGITGLKLITEYQRNFYIHGGIRNIWQSHKECVDFDEETIFIPKSTACKFKNLEFDTNIKFDEKGRYSNHPVSDKKGIAVIGDSHAMGWGVNDNETFSYILEKKINRPVFNLAVSGYGTIRELIRLEKSKVLSQIDTVIIQYCYNDSGENNFFQKNSYDEARKKFDLMVNGAPVSNYKKFRKTIRYSATIPIDIITKKNKSLNFDSNKDLLIKTIKKFPNLSSKKILVFYTNGYDIKFFNFPNEKSKEITNLEFIDLKLKDKHFFKIDGHLKGNGHKFIAEKLSKVFL